MTDSLVQQLVDLKAEHELMLEALKNVEWEEDNELNLAYCPWCAKGYYFGAAGDTPIEKWEHESNCLRQIAIKAAEEGNKRRAAGNVDLPDRRGTK